MLMFVILAAAAAQSPRNSRAEYAEATCDMDVSACDVASLTPRTWNLILTPTGSGTGCCCDEERCPQALTLRDM